MPASVTLRLIAPVEPPVPKLSIVRYEHGGARIYLEHPNGSRDLVVDIYDKDNAERRERIIAVLSADGVLE